MQFASYRNLRGDEIMLAGGGLGWSLNPIDAVKSVGTAVASGAGAVYSGVSSVVGGAFSVGGTITSVIGSIPSSAVFLGKMAVKIPSLAVSGLTKLVSPVCSIVNSTAGQVASVVASTTPQGAVGSVAAQSICGRGAPPPPAPGTPPPGGPPTPAYNPYSGGYGPPVTPPQLPFFRASNPLLWLGALGVVAGAVAVSRKR